MLSFTSTPNSINSYTNQKYKNLITSDAIDLVLKMLEVDHSLRITAKEALNHPYLNIKSSENNLNNNKDRLNIHNDDNDNNNNNNKKNSNRKKI